MNANEKLPTKAGSRKRMLGLGCLGIVGLALVCGLIATVFNAIGGDDDEPVVAEAQATAAATPSPDPEPPMITEHHIDATVTFMRDEPQVNDLTISVENDTVTIAIIVDHAANDDRAREILDSAVRWLASQAAMSSDAIESPSNEHLGGVWDHYTLQVGAGPDAQTFYARGTKDTNNPAITWD